jgi:hypothetical protein
VLGSPHAYFADPACPGSSPAGTARIRDPLRHKKRTPGGITAWIDYGSRTEKATFYGTIVGDRQVWPAADRMAAWLHETALRLFPESPYAKEHSTEAPKKATKPAKD